MTYLSPGRPRSLATYLNPLFLGSDMARHSTLIGQFMKREILGRYRGSVLGLMWPFINPLFMLAVYSYVFAVIFHSHWTNNPREPAPVFPLMMFCGIVVVTIFTECVARAPMLVLAYPNMVKKVVFPLQILVVAAVGASLTFAVFSMLVLLLGIAVLLKPLAITAICLPLIIMPVVFLGLGVSWFLASLGVYFRDLGPFMVIMVQVLFFATPVCYPPSMVPKSMHWVLLANPLSIIVTQMRNILIIDRWPNWPELGAVLVISLIVAQLGYAWFMKTKQGFADVL